MSLRARCVYVIDECAGHRHMVLGHCTAFLVIGTMYACILGTGAMEFTG